MYILWMYGIYLNYFVRCPPFFLYPPSSSSPPCHPSPSFLPHLSLALFVIPHLLSLNCMLVLTVMYLRTLTFKPLSMYLCLHPSDPELS